MIPVWLGKKSAEVRLKTALCTDKRVKFMFSILNGIQIIKMYAWEYSFGRIIKSVRKKEIDEVGKSFNIKAALLSFSVSTEIAIFLSLITYVYLDNSITAQKAFVTIAYFNYINHSLVGRQEFCFEILKFNQIFPQNIGQWQLLVWQRGLCR